ncbi:MAG: DMT family transporter [Chlamydiales bacterium]
MSTHLLGISLAVLSMLCFAITYAFYKGCVPYLPNTHAIFFQSLMSWLLILPFALKDGVKALISPQLGKIIARTLFGILGLYCITRALQTTGLAEVITLNNAAPLFVPLILWIWHRTKISKKLALGLLIGFIGVWVIFRPGFQEIHLDLVIAFLSAIFTALLLVVTRQIAHEPFMRILFYYFLLFWLVLLPFVLASWVPIPPFVWLYILGAALAMIAAQVSFTMALRQVPSQEVAPFLYTTVIFGGLIDWWIWKETPHLISLVGMAIVCTGGIMTINFSQKKT